MDSSYQIIGNRSFLYSLILLFWSSHTACSQQAEISNDHLIPREALFSPVKISDVKMNWTGDKIAFIKESQLYEQFCSSDAAPQLIPNTNKLSEWYWTYHNAIIYIKQNKLYEFKNQRLDSLIFENCKALKVIALSPKLPNQLILELRFQEETQDGLYLIFLDKSEAPKKIMDLQGFDEWYFDENLKLKAATKPNYTEDHSLWYLDSLNGWHLIADYQWQTGNYYQRINQVISVSVDGKELYFMDNQNTDKVVLKKMSLESGQVNILYEDSLADLLWNETLIDNKSQKPLVLQSFFGASQYHFLDESLKTHFEFLQKQKKGDIKIWNTSLDGRYWLVSFMNGYPSHYYHYDRLNQTLEDILTSSPQLSPYKLSSRHPLMVSTTDSLLLPSWYFIPIEKDTNQDGIPDEPLPTVFYIHGGPWLGFSQNSWYTNRNLQLLANRGYAVIYVEFRGALGYGKKFTEASYQEWGRKMQEDVITVVNACVEKGISEKDKMAIFGWSYGGYATLRELTFSPQTFVCGISMFGVTDLLDFLENQRFNPQIWQERVGNWKTEDGKKLLRKASPFYQLKNIEAPLLITHGGKDQSIPPKYSDQTVEALQNLDKEVTYIFYPNEPHNYRKDETWISFWVIAEQFLKQQLGGNAQSPTNDLQKSTYQILVGKGNITGIDD